MKRKVLGTNPSPEIYNPLRLARDVFSAGTVHATSLGLTTAKSLNAESNTQGWPAAAAAAKSLQPCPTLCNPTDGSPPCSPIPGILQARTLEWVAISFSHA